MHDSPLGHRGDEVTAALAGQESNRLNADCLPRGLWLAFRMKTLVALAHWPAGLTFRENVLNLGFAAREIAIGWFPRWNAGWLVCDMNLLIFYIVRHDGCILS